MQPLGSPLTLNRQNNALAIRLITPTFGHLPPDVVRQYGLTHRKPYYFFFFTVAGSSQHGVDLQQFKLSQNQLLFVVPHQIHQLPLTKEDNDYFKLGFDETCLSMLPRQYPFLVNPFDNPKVDFTPSAAGRLKAVFLLLQDLLARTDSETDLLLAYLNSLLTEINGAYFAAARRPTDENFSAYVRFKIFVENNLTQHLTMQEIAHELALNTNRLYTIVKKHSGFSPKVFVTNRLMVEAKRRLYYAESSIKGLAYDLGFNDPEYFARLFKKETGQTIATFIQDLSGN